MITLDGSYLEGGGALVRTALALSCLTGKSFEVKNIRAGRKVPGLKAQHLAAINALRKFCKAKTNEISLGSEHLRFVPGDIQKGNFEIDIGTAGSISLLLQALILPAVFAPGKVTFTITGGTCGKWQASVDYIRNVLFPHLQKFVEKIELKVLKRGYYPKGGGVVQVEVTRRFSKYSELQVATIDLLEGGELEQVRGIVNLSTELQEKDVGDRISNAVRSGFTVPTDIRVEYANSANVGGEVVLWGVCSKDGTMDPDNPIILGADTLLEQGKTSEQIGKEVSQKLKKELDVPVDSHLADQLIVYMGLVPGSAIRTSHVTHHTLTNIYVVEKFLDVTFSVEGETISVKNKVN